MIRRTVYLAGPISGLSFDDATDWRRDAIKRLAEHDIDGLDPMRGKDYLASESSLADNYAERNVMSTSRGITTRDRFDCHRADLVIANFENAEKVSIGTVMEVAWADAARNPVIVVMEEGNPHWHSMIRECAGFIVPTLDDAIELAIVMLATHRGG